MRACRQITMLLLVSVLEACIVRDHYIRAKQIRTYTDMQTVVGRSSSSGLLHLVHSMIHRCNRFSKVWLGDEMPGEIGSSFAASPLRLAPLISWSRMGAMESPMFPIWRNTLHFLNLGSKGPVGREMVAVFDSGSSSRVAVSPEGNCEWVEQIGPHGSRHRVAASCFSKSGTLEKIIISHRQQVSPDSVNDQSLGP
jgi:hypothetical protein